MVTTFISEKSSAPSEFRIYIFHFQIIFFFFDRSYDVIINCTGLGAQKLCNDINLSPIRGQVIRVKAPWIKFAAYADNDTYIIPGSYFKPVKMIYVGIYILE